MGDLLKIKLLISLAGYPLLINKSESVVRLGVLKVELLVNITLFIIPKSQLNLFIMMDW